MRNYFCFKYALNKFTRKFTVFGGDVQPQSISLTFRVDAKLDAHVLPVEDCFALHFTQM